ncbi:hypothetical protein EYZ11_005646 [Aspergillus tanneri]|uniref:Uncharacterized protein n=2 Tax=Aspergillus tanneri TaxID=1220188 RepID=A0A4V3UPF0_9EURO|nr:hypothetical protein EYZ11_005646 [Aspergillus tanneri]
MVKRTQSAIFVDFPGHDLYKTVMKTITRGDPEKAQTMFSAHILKISPDSAKGEVVQENKVDIKEQFSIHAYQDLLDFITNFQKTRSGKPTKRMLAEILNVFLSIVVQRNTIKGENHDYTKIDWSINGPWSVHRRLFGLNKFAGTITSLAMQQPNTDIRDKILPHHVFQLQSIVDSLTVSRGWSLSTLRGHILSPPARGFRPRRDVDLFLDRNNEMIGSGYLNGVDVLRQLLEKDSILHADPNRHQAQSELLQGVQEDFINWLGESNYMHGLQTIPLSCFSSTNGLWEYSPFLCGVGLIEGLEITYLLNMKIWDRIPEPVLLIHLHNMLLQKGYITKPIGLYASLEELFPSSFFSAGKVPTSNFAGALLARINETGSRRLIFERKATARTAARSAVDIHGLLDVNANRFFRTKSTLTLYRQVDWDPERIADSDIRVTSFLGMARLGQKKQLIGPMTGERRLEDTELVNRARAQGMDELALLDLLSLLGRLKANDDVRLPENLLGSSSKGQRLPELSKRTGGATHPNDVHNDLKVTGQKLLELLKWDIFADVCGEQPLLSLNYVWVTARFIMLFMQIEEELRRLKNPLYVRAYETEREWRWHKRVGLTMMALSGEDNECLQTMAREFQNPRVGFMTHIYWKDIEEMGTRIKSLNQRTKTNEGVDGCVVM